MAPAPPDLAQAKAAVRKTQRKDADMTVGEAVLQVVQDSRREISKSEIRIRAMRLMGPFSESALNSALSHWVEEKQIINTARGYYAAA